jgi:YHS domain-containing protein
MSFRFRAATLGALLVLSFAGLALAAEKDHANVDSDHVGVKGYDPVSYFDGKPQAGDEKITFEYDGVMYRFVNEANRDKFKSEPAHFVPACGGWCAYAFAVDKGKVDIDPTRYNITDGRLFLFYKGWRGDALKEWLKDEKNYIPKADANWKKTAVGK